MSTLIDKDDLAAHCRSGRNYGHYHQAPAIHKKPVCVGDSIGTCVYGAIRCFEDPTMHLLIEIVAGLDSSLLPEPLNIYLSVQSEARNPDCPVRRLFGDEYWMACVIPNLLIH